MQSSEHSLQNWAIPQFQVSTTWKYLIVTNLFMTFFITPEAEKCAMHDYQIIVLSYHVLNISKTTWYQILQFHREEAVNIFGVNW